ncbi:recombination-associated protein RdgC [Wohlfahrtiimonas chitiniclastica]|uniref:Recombination-associated protein RdgC n=1 Tax=Wohlfahrtiimonas chitiniclastica TaxID=400946 RepID=A0AB35BYW3_9GAMM|nr:recombination-associated protein RdgC [Wohlfahrtiimonas chitiniclastica]MBS7824906.1 recombination-associated protein RdgC [Wohlfahrtiimonas chitiniclastica]MBS7828112.1 recombination-associated protein RdgC [Wohlfahrtiimonas chitiniclastica]MBS7835792.1 recombination-associated protein RdgC [Wohlfahrtiimonas chitiniclastica]MBS7840515.1 recombination-associated protein RdgC [Wohlfahrtiimonas chitiniclastica]MDC7252812.1 recombination-associated protein RdgC [Wohlfahrtiimonas chitiniclastic
MSFKNLLIYRFEEPFNGSLEEMEAQLSAKPLTSCLTEELESLGWLPIYKDGQQYVEKVNQALFVRLGIEHKILPNSAVKTAVEKKIEEKNLKNVSRSELKELTEMVTNELLPNALVNRSSMLAYIDLEKNWLVVDASSAKKASLLTSHLRKTLGSLPIIPLVPDHSVTAAMTHWVQYGVESDALDLLYDVELKEMKDEGGNAKFKGVPLDAKEIQEPLKEGWQVTKLSLGFDEQVTFSMAGDFVFKRLKFLERFQENLDHDDDPAAAMQAEWYLAVDVYRKLIDHVYALSNHASNA